jgi:hypothetical protein
MVHFSEDEMNKTFDLGMVNRLDSVSIRIHSSDALLESRIGLAIGLPVQFGRNQDLRRDFFAV